MTSSSVENLIRAANGPKVSSPVINCAPDQPKVGREVTHAIVGDVGEDGRDEFSSVASLAPDQNLGAFRHSVVHVLYISSHFN